MLWRKSSPSLSGLYAVYFGLLIGEVNAPPHFQPSAGTVKDTKKHVSPPRIGYLEARFPLLLWLPTASDLTNHSQIALLSGRQGIRLNCITYERLRCKWLGDVSTLQIRCIQGYGWAYVILTLAIDNKLGGKEETQSSNQIDNILWLWIELRKGTQLPPLLGCWDHTDKPLVVWKL